jgi:glycosyltransferase involved in cell wall biosynthesis
MAPPRTLFTGPFEHRHLVQLLPLADVTVVPSIFPEAFGMVAAEGAACAALPIVADHSGLREVARDLARHLPDEAQPLLSFSLDGDPVRELAARLTGWLDAPDELRVTVRQRLAATAQERYSWAGVARVAVAAASRGPEGLPEV